MTNTFDFYIYPREADASKRISLQNIGAFILDAAGMAAKARGFGMDYMHANGLAWVTSRIAIEMTEYPHEYETISIETWVEDCSSIFSTRNFLIYNNKKEVIGQASTLWSMIDFNTRKMVDLLKTTKLAEHVVTTQNELFSIDKPKRVDYKGEGEPTMMHRVVVSDIDMNQHVNSMKYLQWAIDTLSLDDIMNTTIKRLDINYLREALYNQNIGVYSDDFNNQKRFELRNEAGQACCKIQLTMQ
jgi:acyl-ACP thioesterase